MSTTSRKKPIRRRKSRTPQISSVRKKSQRRTRRSTQRQTTSIRRKSQRRRRRQPSSIKRRKSQRRKRQQPSSVRRKSVQPPLRIFVKNMIGDLVQIEISKNDTVLSLKRMVTDMLNMKMDKTVRMIHPEIGDLEDKKPLGKYGIKDEDILMIVSDYTDEPPFKGEKWIKLAGKDLRLLNTENRLNYVKQYGENASDYVKHYSKLRNPALAGYDIHITALPNIISGIPFEGNVNDQEFLRLLDVEPSEKTKFLKFMNELKDVVHEDQQLKYVYFTTRGSVYNDTYFIVTNADSSIVYEHSPSAQQNRIYIRGYFIKISTWRALTYDERKQMIEDDEFLKHVLVNEWKYIDRMSKSKK